jgi:hypothetical protein
VGCGPWVLYGVGDNLIERKWLATTATLTAFGTSRGMVTVDSTLGFRVKAIVRLTQALQPTLSLEVKRVNSPTSMEIGPVGHIDDRIDLTPYGAGSVVFMPTQPRTDIPLKDIDRATYEEEPVVARRVTQVDEFGRIIGGGAPVNVNVVSGGSGSSFNYDAWTETYDADKNLMVVKYYLASVLVRTITMTRDADGDIISGTRV